MKSGFETRAGICRPFKETRNRFPAWRAGTTTLFFVPARQATQLGGIDSSESILGLLKSLKIRAQDSRPGIFSHRLVASGTRYQSPQAPIPKGIKYTWEESQNVVIERGPVTDLLGDGGGGGYRLPLGKSCSSDDV
jgi:hypothetical protein